MTGSTEPGPRSADGTRAGDVGLRFVGRLAGFEHPARTALPADADFTASVGAFIERVRAEGDDALRALAERFDGVRLTDLEVPRSALRAALDEMDAGVTSALRAAADAIAAVHRAQLPEPVTVATRPGVRVTRLAEPLDTVGVYAPGGRAAYPSSVLMGVVPARVAGVGRIVVCSPPGPDGRPPSAVLAACAIAGADRVFALGGAGAVAAMAFGTATVPRVDRIVGPGNAWVTEAKRQLAGVVGIDSPAGPSEILIIADDDAAPDALAAELIAQAEHDPDARAILVSTSARVLEAVRAALADRLPGQPREAIVRASFERNGALLLADDLEAALAFATAWAPEHLSLRIAGAGAAAARVRGAGTIFLGPHSSVTFGDYVTGANHVLPTDGAARMFSGLSSLDFMRWVTHQEVTPEGAAALAPLAAALAEAEGLPGHAAAARLHGAGIDPGAAAVPRRPPPPLRPDYATLRTYDPGRAPCAIDLSDNTNLFGPAPGVLAALAALEPAQLTRYPSVYADTLRQAWADVCGTDPGHVATGAGSDDVIDSALRAFARPGARLALPVPTFGIMPAFAAMNGLQVAPVPLRPDYALDVESLLAQQACVTYLCRPNNPTGTPFDRSAVEQLVAHAAGIVLIDEAYADFADDDLLDLALASDRVVVLRTLSKAWGLAGARVGFAVGPARLIAEIEKSRGPYKIGAPAEAAALAALRQRAWVAERIAEVRANRDRLRAALVASGHAVLDSTANFVLVPAPPRTGGAVGLAASLRTRGVAVRAFPALPVAGDCIRVSIGPWSMLEHFLEAFFAVVREAGGATGRGGT